MNDTEVQVRHLFALATQDLPADIDLLGGLRARIRARATRVRLVYSAVIAGAVTTVLAALLVGAGDLALSVSRPPSALAQVVSAADRTAARSYGYSFTVILAQRPSYGAPPQRITSSGSYDPAMQAGAESTSFGTRILVLRGYLYFGHYKGLNGKPFDGKPWFRVRAGALRSLNRGQPDLKGSLIASGFGYSQISPQRLLALLKSASRVRETGRASGPGWQGLRYVFAGTTLSRMPKIVTRFSGTVTVDQQGRVRQLQSTFTRTLSPPASIVLTTRVAVTFDDFGVRVSVTPPPLRDTAILRGVLVVG